MEREPILERLARLDTCTVSDAPDSLNLKGARWGVRLQWQYTRIVIDNGGRLEFSTWGGLLSLAATLKGVAGVVIDGAYRDIDEARDLDFPVYARGVVPMSARGRVMQESFNREVQFAGVQVHPGSGDCRWQRSGHRPQGK